MERFSGAHTPDEMFEFALAGDDEWGVTAGVESDDFDLPDWDNLEFRPDSNFSAFFGQGIDGEHGLGAIAQKCPACGFSLDKLGRTNRLGGPSCYEFFRVALKPVLERLHRHSSHFGKVPWKNGGELKLESEIARHRVALEKAVVSENFEEAARLRDLITRLESGDEEPTEGADEQEER